ncbi:MAG: hypothetical protein WCT32_00205 [Patescibacteria group bacterium]|jgi:hypothetical protein
MSSSDLTNGLGSSGMTFLAWFAYVGFLFLISFTVVAIKNALGKKQE